jgi:hypothetical protein
MTGRRLVVLALALLALPAPVAGQLGGAPLGPEGTKAYAMARAAEDAADAARAEGEAVVRALDELAATAKDPEPLKGVQADAAAAQEALLGYRTRALEHAGEALQLLADVTRAAVTTPPLGSAPAPSGAGDPVRREVFEQKALLAAHEASVMAARARAEAERLRAIQAEARALVATARPARPGGAPPAPPGPEASASRDVEVPNLVGARLDAATRDLQAAGLRLGPTTGPREGWVVKQTPAAGARAPRQSAVAVTLSTTAVGVTPVLPR